MSMCDYCTNNGVCNQPLWILKAVKNEEMYCDRFKVFSMPKISMNRTTSSFVTENKTVTRRHWQPVTIKRFKKDTKFLAVQRCYGGEALGVGQLTENPFKQSTKDMVAEDYEYEGFEFLDDRYVKIVGSDDTYPLLDAFDRWQESDQILTVVPFEIIEVFPGMKVKYNKDEEIRRCVKALVKVIG